MIVNAHPCTACGALVVVGYGIHCEGCGIWVCPTPPCSWADEHEGRYCTRCDREEEVDDGPAA